MKTPAAYYPSLDSPAAAVDVSAATVRLAGPAGASVQLNYNALWQATPLRHAACTPLPPAAPTDPVAVFEVAAPSATAAVLGGLGAALRDPHRAALVDPSSTVALLEHLTVTPEGPLAVYMARCQRAYAQARADLKRLFAMPGLEGIRQAQREGNESALGACVATASVTPGDRDEMACKLDANTLRAALRCDQVSCHEDAVVALVERFGQRHRRPFGPGVREVVAEAHLFETIRWESVSEAALARLQHKGYLDAKALACIGARRADPSAWRPRVDYAFRALLTGSDDALEVEVRVADFPRMMRGVADAGGVTRLGCGAIDGRTWQVELNITGVGPDAWDARPALRLVSGPPLRAEVSGTLGNVGMRLSGVRVFDPRFEQAGDANGIDVRAPNAAFSLYKPWPAPVSIRAMRDKEGAHRPGVRWLAPDHSLVAKITLDSR